MSSPSAGDATGSKRPADADQKLEDAQIARICSCYSHCNHKCEARETISEVNDNDEPEAHSLVEKPRERLFGSKPRFAWDCARTRPATQFSGLEELQLVWFRGRRYALSFQVYSFVERYTSLRFKRLDLAEPDRKQQLRMQASSTEEFVASFFATLLGNPYAWRPIETKISAPPPKGLYVVVGIFDSSGALRQEVIIYNNGQSFSQQLVIEYRRLFSIPILRDIKAFGVYKCTAESCTHTIVSLGAEDTDCLASLFKHVQKWESFYMLRRYWRASIVIMGVSGLIYTSLVLIVMAIALITVLRRIPQAKSVEDLLGVPKPREEIEWRDWIQDNLNKGSDEPAKGRYSLLCVIGWSRANIIFYVAVPFILMAVASVTFGFLWSIDFHGHAGDVASAWTISSYIVTLAAAVAALIGLVGGLVYT